MWLQSVVSTIKGLFLYIPLAKSLLVVALTCALLLVLQALIFKPTFGSVSFMAAALGLILMPIGATWQHFLEYAVHRWWFHGDKHNPYNKKQQPVLYALKELHKWLGHNHDEHHKRFTYKFVSRDREDLKYVTTFWVITPIVLIVHATLGFTLCWAFGIPVIVLDLFLLGAVTLFVVFEVLHYAMHVEGSIINMLSQYMQQHHTSHHKFVKQRFGVLSDWFDMRLKTFRPL